MKKPICLVENVRGSLQVNKSAVDYLNKINQPVVVVGVVGLYRTGKSYLMNRLAGENNGFALGSTIESKTKGIWMWCVPHPSKPGHTLVLLDTEGLGDVDKGDSKNDSWIFCLAILLSSTLIYNSRGTIDNQALENLHYVTELTEHIKVKAPPSKSAKTDDDDNGDDSKFVEFFPNFVWAVRDFTLKLEIENREVTEDGYLNFALQMKKGSGKKIADYNLPRECIQNYFPSRKCFVFPMPASQDDMSRLESLKETELLPKFVTVTKTFCDYVFSQSHVKTVKGGHKVNGRMLGHLVHTYVDTISSGKVPCLENAVVAMATLENKRAVEHGLKLYNKEMEQIISLFPIKLCELSAEHQKHSNMASVEFMKLSFKDENGEYFKSLMEEIDKIYKVLLIQNMNESEKKCWKILNDLCKKMDNCMQQGLYAKPGGYKLYCKERDIVIINYNKEPNKGDKAEDVLQEFMIRKNAEGNAILVTDKQLTHAEKKLQEEKEKSALVMQKFQAEKIKKQELERLIRVERENNKQRIEQLERKLRSEKLQLQKEMERAMDCKLREQKALLEKGFEKKSQKLQNEIEMYKKERNTVRTGSSSNLLMTLGAFLPLLFGGIGGGGGCCC